MAALSFAGDLMHLRSGRRSQAGSDAGAEPGEEAAAGATGVDTAAQAVGQPGSLRKRVLQAFSTHDLPVHKPLSLPTLSLELACPGAPAGASVLAVHGMMVCVQASVAANAGLG